MLRHRVTAFSVAVVVFALALVSRVVGAQDAAVEPRAKSPADVRSEAVLARVCGTACHEWQRVGDSRRTKAQWEMVIDDMINRGAPSTDADYDVVLDYVLRHHAFVNVNKAPAEELSLVIGLAPEEAEAIVSDRLKAGKFADFSALSRVGGVDPKKLEAARLSLLY